MVKSVSSRQQVRATTEVVAADTVDSEVTDVEAGVGVAESELVPLDSMNPTPAAVCKFRIISGTHYDAEGQHSPDENDIVYSIRDLAKQEPERYVACV